ncbi:MAG: serine/threonine protein kinase [Candidatus Wallbacteria bacterium]|nr:serine/threonine protein kinase [Candidatus Wallbacteria bacterium]
MEQLDKYLLEERLGEGGMAHVWRAVDTSLQRPVVIKLMKLGLDAVERDRFLGEARALTRLRSRHLLEVLDFGEKDGIFYFVMPFVQVACLADLAGLRSSQGRRFEVSEAAALGLQLARALAEAHRHHLVHRDVKPQNVLVTPAGTAFLTDFGIARDLTRETALTQLGTVLGTPRYMAPEQLRGEPIDASTDLYSLGLLLFELLAGHLPAEVPDDLPATLRNRLAGTGERLAETVPEAAPLAGALERLLESVGSGRRPRSADELADELTPLATRADALARVGAEVREMLGSRDTATSLLGTTSPWTVAGQQAMSADEPPPPAAPPAMPAPVRDPVSPTAGFGGAGAPQPGRVQPAPQLARPVKSVPVPRSARPSFRHHRPLLAALIVALALLGVWTGKSRPARELPTIGSVRAIAGFHKVRLQWNGDAKELSLVTPRGHEGLYDVRGRNEWESSSVTEPGVYVASLFTPAGEAVQVPPIEFGLPDLGSIPVQVERDFDAIRVSLQLPVEAEVRAILRGEGLSVARAASTGATRKHSLRIRFDPLEGASLRLLFRSRLAEESQGPTIDLPPLAMAFRKAAAAAAELGSKVQWRSWCARLLKKHYRGEALDPAALGELASLGLDAPFSGLYPAVAGFLDSSRVALEEKGHLYSALSRLQDPDFFCERYGLAASSAATRSLPPSWSCTNASQLSGAEELPLPFSGIMTFKPKVLDKLISYDLLDDISRVEYKETELQVKDSSSIRLAELVLETWALKPDQWFSVSINGRLELEFRPRGLESRERLFKKETLSLYHPVDPSCLLEGKNRLRVSIHSFPPGAVPESAALNAASLFVVRTGGGPGPASGIGASPDRQPRLARPKPDFGR